MNISGVHTTSSSIMVGFEINGEQFEISISAKMLPQTSTVHSTLVNSTEYKAERKKPGPKPGMKKHAAMLDKLVQKKAKAEAAEPNSELQPEQTS